MLSLVVLAILLPIAAASLLVLLDPQAPASRARWGGLIGTVATLALTTGLAASYFDAADIAGVSREIVHPRLELRQTWLTLGTTPTGEPLRCEFFLGVDGISICMILLTALLSVAAVLISWNTVQERAAEFYAALLFLEGSLIGVFCSFDLLLFYVFFELTLLPQFFLMGIWGGTQRREASVRFFLYLLSGSLVTLLGLSALVITAYQRTGLATPFSIPDLAKELSAYPLSTEWQAWLFLAIAAGFIVKAPLFPFHTWLPLAHVQAPTAALLVGVLLKLGPYGFLRLGLPLLPSGCMEVGLPLIGVLSIVGILYGSLCALVQNDMNRLVGYSSAAHVAFCLLGLFALNEEGITGGTVHMLNLGLSTGGLLCVIAMVMERYKTRRISDLGGLAIRMPRLAAAMGLIVFASIGLPGLNGFVGEFLSLAGMFRVQAGFAALAAVGVVLAAWYLLGVMQTVFFGPLKESPDATVVSDLNAREMLIIAPLCGLCLYLGLFPQTLIDVVRPDLEGIVELYRPSPVFGVATAPVPAADLPNR